MLHNSSALYMNSKLFYLISATLNEDNLLTVNNLIAGIVVGEAGGCGGWRSNVFVRCRSDYLVVTMQV